MFNSEVLIPIISAVISRVVSGLLVVQLSFWMNDRRRSKEAWRIMASLDSLTMHLDKCLKDASEAIIRMRAARKHMVERAGKEGRTCIEDMERVDDACNKAESDFAAMQELYATRILDHWRDFDVYGAMQDIVRLGLFDSPTLLNKFKKLVDDIHEFDKPKTEKDPT